MNKKILALVPARGGSKSIHQKNIVPLAGQPLIAHSIKQALDSVYIDKVAVTSDDWQILRIANDHGVHAIQRPEHLASDSSPIDHAIQHALQELEIHYGYQPDLIVLLQPTSPLRQVTTINKAIQAFIELGQGYDSLIPLHPLDGKIGTIKDQTYQPHAHQLGKQRHELPPIHKECGTIFIFRPEVIRAGQFYGKKVYPFIINNFFESLDIDSYHDLDLANYHLSKKI